MANDLTEVSNHIIWLWGAISGIGSLCLLAYIRLRDRDECLSDKINASEMQIKIQLAEIKTTLANVEATLLELKRDIKRRNEP
jgi:hypothetical protein